MKPQFTRRNLRAAITLARRKERCEMHERAPHTPRHTRAPVPDLIGDDPRIHPSSQDSFEEDGLPGQARQ
jgi:hypothetical protein